MKMNLKMSKTPVRISPITQPFLWGNTNHASDDILKKKKNSKHFWWTRLEEIGKFLCEIPE